MGSRTSNPPTKFGTYISGYISGYFITTEPVLPSPGNQWFEFGKYIGKSSPFMALIQVCGILMNIVIDPEICPTLISFWGMPRLHKASQGLTADSCRLGYSWVRGQRPNCDEKRSLVNRALRTMSKQLGATGTVGMLQEGKKMLVEMLSINECLLSLLIRIGL